MSADLGLPAAQYARAIFLKVITGRDYILHLVAYMVDATRWVFLEEAVDRAVIAKRVKKLDLGIWKFYKDHRDTMIGLILRPRLSGIALQPPPSQALQSLRG